MGITKNEAEHFIREVVKDCASGYASVDDAVGALTLFVQAAIEGDREAVYDLLAACRARSTAVH